MDSRYDERQRRRDSHSPPSRSKSPRGDRREDRGDLHPRRSHHGSRHSTGRNDSHRHQRDHRARERSPKRHEAHHKRRRSPKPETNAALPFNARALTRSDYRAFYPLLAYYLDLQKGKILSHMDEREAKGRWKSFLRKWNSGELSEGWYDPEMFAAAQEREHDMPPMSEHTPSGHRDPSQDNREEEPQHGGDDDDDDDDDDVGPALPPTSRATGQRLGPGIPNLDDLAARREELSEDAQTLREQQIDDLRFARKQDRKRQKEHLEELVPRAEPGSRERRLEKRAAVNEKMRGFREKSPGDAAVGERDLMGGGDGIDDLKRQRSENERRKTEREIRREEIARAKAEEREERLREYREREEETMKALKELAKQRFG